jgi:hypothetical protein
MLTTLTEKEVIIKTVQDLPENTCIEEAMERLYFLYKVEKGIKEADSGQCVSHKKAKKRMKKLLIIEKTKHKSAIINHK